MSETREPKPEQPKLQLISIERTESGYEIWTLKPKQITGKEYRRMLRKWALAFGVSLGINIAQAIMIYVLQAGPV